MTIQRRVLRFAAVGATGTLIQYGVLWGGVSLFSIPAAISSGIGYAFGSICNYWLNYFFTFKSDKSHAEAASRYYSVIAVGWCINTAMMGLLVHHWGLNYWLAQLFATGVGFVWNFAGSHWWAFKPSNSGDGPRRADREPGCRLGS